MIKCNISKLAREFQSPGTPEHKFYHASAHFYNTDCINTENYVYFPSSHIQNGKFKQNLNKIIITLNKIKINRTYWQHFKVASFTEFSKLLMLFPKISMCNIEFLEDFTFPQAISQKLLSNCTMNYDEFTAWLSINQRLRNWNISETTTS